MEKPERISVAQAAALMGKSTEFVREGLKRGVLPIGYAQRLEGNYRWNFYISPPKLAAYIGSKAPELPDGLQDAPRGDMFTDDQIIAAMSIFMAAMKAASRDDSGTKWTNWLIEQSGATTGLATKDGGQHG